jgi:hypothetical protein
MIVPNLHRSAFAPDRSGPTSHNQADQLRSAYGQADQSNRIFPTQVLSKSFIGLACSLILIAMS